MSSFSLTLCWCLHFGPSLQGLAPYRKQPPPISTKDVVGTFTTVFLSRENQATVYFVQTLWGPGRVRYGIYQSKLPSLLQATPPWWTHLNSKTDRTTVSPPGLPWGSWCTVCAPPGGSWELGALIDPLCTGEERGCGICGHKLLSHPSPGC